MTSLPASPERDDSLSQTAGDLVYSALKARILGHEFRLGTPLREDEVASWYDTSRVPARDSLRKLEQEGLVERAGRRYQVRQFSYDEVFIIYRQRAALEFLAVEYAAEARNGPGGLAALADIRAVIEDQRQAIQRASRSEFSHLDKEFHLRIARVSGKGLLVRELEIILNRVQLIRTAELERDAGPVGAFQDHCRIFQALERGDAATAKAELEYHYTTTVRLHKQATASDTPAQETP